MKAPVPILGHEFRGHKIRLYPTLEQIEMLRDIQRRERRVWNSVVTANLDAVVKWREKLVAENLVKHPPARPNNDAGEELWLEYKEAYSNWIESCGAPPKEIYIGVRELLSKFSLRHDYQLGNMVLVDYEMEPLPANILQGLFHGMRPRKGQRMLKTRKHDSDMPIVMRSGQHFEFGNFGDRRDNPGWYNAAVSVPGMGRIRARSHRPRAQWRRILQGVAITCAADGWYAAVRGEFPICGLPEPVTGLMAGIDVGRHALAAVVHSTGASELVNNPRGDSAYLDRISGMQARGADPSRLQQRAARRARQLNYELARDLIHHEWIFVEDLAKIGRVSKIGGSPRVSGMTETLRILERRLGDRVRAVPPAFTSQDCSQCGHRCKDAWPTGSVGQCPACGFREHRDLNAARNILNKGSKELNIYET